MAKNNTNIAMLPELNINSLINQELFHFHRKHPKIVNSLYSLIMGLFMQYPSVISFCEHIRGLNNKNTFLGFLSRDAYFFYLLYKNMYPELTEGIDYAYIYSSRLCYAHNERKLYYDYINYYRQKREKLLLIDIHGSGNTFTKFIHKFSIRDIDLLFFCKFNSNLSDNRYVSGYFNKNKFTIKVLDEIEKRYRAPHRKITKVILNKNNNTFYPYYLIYDKDGFDRNADKDSILLAKIYARIINYMPYTKHIRYLTYNEYIVNKNINYENISYNGILFLDIDDTIAHIPDYTFSKKLISYCDCNNIKVVLVTARQMPFSYGPKFNQTINTIETVLDNISYDYKNNYLIVWYNPYTFINTKPELNKAMQIKKTLNDYKIPTNKCVFIDDNNFNVDTVKKEINVKTWLAKNGITQDIHDEVIEFFSS